MGRAITFFERWQFRGEKPRVLLRQLQKVAVLNLDPRCDVDLCADGLGRAIRLIISAARSASIFIIKDHAPTFFTGKVAIQRPTQLGGLFTEIPAAPVVRHDHREWAADGGWIFSAISETRRGQIPSIHRTEIGARFTTHCVQYTGGLHAA